MKNLIKNYSPILFGAAVLLLFMADFSFPFPFKGNLKCIVIDSETNKPVANAAVQIISENLFTTTNSEGYFSFNNLIAASYFIKITHVAYKENLSEIKFNESNNIVFVIYMIPKAIEISTVLVTDQNRLSKLENIQELTNVLKGKELQKNLGLTLAATLKNETGLAIRSMGPAPARPVIRGLGGDRVFISEDGIKTSDLSATSPDHAVTIEPFSTERIEVIRGPKVLTKTPVTIGGVVNVVRNEIPMQIHDGIFGTVGFYGETANRGYLASLVTEIPISKFAARIELSKKNASDLSTPVGKLNNSNSKNLNYALSSSYYPSFGVVGASFRRFELDYGVPGGFIGAHPDGVDISLYKNQFNFLSEIKIDSKYFDKLHFKYSTSLYRHKEFEKSGNIGSEFRIINNAGEINLPHKKIGLFNSGVAGISFEHRDFDIGGFVFTSPTKSINISAFLFEEFSTDKFSFETSARFNYDKIKPFKEKPDSKIGYIRERTFNTYSLSASILYELTNIVFIGTNISKSSRVPTIEELFSEGPHLAAYSYETGDPSLSAETGFGSEFFIYHNFKNIFFHINYFRNDLSNYVIPRNTGKINYATFLPIYASSGVSALIYGFEGQIKWNFFGNMNLDISSSYTRGKFRDNGNSLPQIPPFKTIIGLNYSEYNYNFGITSEIISAQKEVDTFEESTPGYAIVNAFGQFSFEKGIFIHSISLNAENIFNKEYRNHLSRVKVILPEAGFNVRLTYKLFYHL